MGRLIVYLLGLGVIGGAAYFYVSGHGSVLPPAQSEAQSAPKETLDRARETAKRIEQDAQRRADELMDKTQ